MTLKNNLPPESQPWGRDIENRIAALELFNTTNGSKALNTNAGLQASLQALAQQIVQQIGVKKVSASNTAGTSIAAATTTFIQVNTATITAPSWAANAILIIPTYTSLGMNTTGTTTAGQTYGDMQVTVGGTGLAISPLTSLDVGAISGGYFTDQALMATNVWANSVTGGQSITVVQQTRKSRTDTTGCTAKGQLDVIGIFTK